MRVCRFRDNGQVATGFYTEAFVVPVQAAARQFKETTHHQLVLPDDDDLLRLLPHGDCHEAATELSGWLERQGNALAADAKIPLDKAEFLLPIPRPNKLLLLAGNYAEHIEEGGGVAAQRAETFPYVFMKPPTTTLTHPGKNVVIPRVSPDAIDWELELAVVVGQQAKEVPEADALKYLAGYTVVNDISNRKFRPNPERKERKNDAFFDWLHGKWHDSFCPCGPCVASADVITDPQALKLQLRVNGDLKQDSSTANQIFPVAAVVSFVSSIVTLEPGDIIATGTPAGVGNTTGTYLKTGDTIAATIERIGTLHSPVVMETDTNDP